MRDLLSRIEPWMGFCMGARNELAGDRNMNGYIPWMALRDYGSHHGLKGYPAETFLAVMLGFDRIMAANETSKGSKDAPQD